MDPATIATLLIASLNAVAACVAAFAALKRVQQRREENDDA